MMIKLHLVTGEGRWARSYCGRTIFGKNHMVCGTPDVEKFRGAWVFRPSHVCTHCVKIAKALKII